MKAAMTLSIAPEAVPQRIIISRKGFDKAAGGCASPILPDGTLLSLPIPESEEHVNIRTRYEDLGRAPKLPSAVISPRGNRTALRGPVHLDPDLRPGLRKSTTNAQELIFGQDDGPQSTLHDSGVCAGDLFLFFGWFRDSGEIGAGGEVQLRYGANDLHILWGWLQVDRAVPVSQNGTLPADLAHLVHHPHLEERNRPNNCVYIARQTLSFVPGIAGGGVFPRYEERLQLTAPGETRRSYWRLPLFFREVKLGFHQTRNVAMWEPRADGLYGQSVRRGQEFVFATVGVECKVAGWLETVFSSAV
jgi:Nucleotide modification associated domain 3